MVYDMGGVSTSNDGGEGTVGYHIAPISSGCNTPYNSKKFNGAYTFFRWSLVITLPINFRRNSDLFEKKIIFLAQIFTE